ncbi:hypothetical protein HanIR_Chr01g0036341 [Helianthus annuus]|nr:hypothetical protein HanIR_Chr01g0036341 [Helianthus annuus]
MLGTSTNVPKSDVTASNDWSTPSSLLFIYWSSCIDVLRSRSVITSITLSQQTVYHSNDLQHRWTRG